MDDQITHLPPAFLHARDRLPWPSVAVTRRAMRLLVRMATVECAAQAFATVMRDLITHERVLLSVTQTTPLTQRRRSGVFVRTASATAPVVLDHATLTTREFIAPSLVDPARRHQRGCYRATMPPLFGLHPVPLRITWELITLDGWSCAVAGDA